MSKDELIVKTEHGTVWKEKDGSFTADASMATVNIDPDGNISTTLKIFKQVDISDISKIISYKVSKIGDEKTHEIEFENQSDAILKYKEGHPVPDINGNNLKINISPEGVITLSAGD